MMALFPLFCVAPLAGCSTPGVDTPDSLYEAPPWPDGKALAANPQATQKDVSRFLERARAVYDVAVAKLAALRQIDKGEKTPERL